MGFSKKRGRRTDRAGICESRASNKFGHGEEMELFGIDNAGRYQWRRGEAERVDVSLSLSLTNPIKSSAVRCASTRIHTVYAKARPGRPVHSHDIYTHSAYKAKCNEKRSSHFSDEIKDPST